MRLFKNENFLVISRGKTLHYKNRCEEFKDSNDMPPAYRSAIEFAESIFSKFPEVNYVVGTSGKYGFAKGGYVYCILT